MVAKTVALPNIRRMFIPGLDKMLIDIDLERADAQVVAWEADDDELKDMFRSGADVHRENAAAVFRIASQAVTDRQRQIAKQGVHGTNYGGSAKTIAAETGMTIAEAEYFQTRWFEAHPKIKENYHNKVKEWLLNGHKTETGKYINKRTIYNAFGYNYTFFDRVIGNNGDLDPKKFHEALAWVPQSTVAVVTNLGLIAIDNKFDPAGETFKKLSPEEKKEHWYVELLLQVHDSLVMQTPISFCPDIYPHILDCMKIEVPYPDPLIIPTSISASSTSWGDLFSFSDFSKLIKAHNDNTPVPEIAKELKVSTRVIEMVLADVSKYEPKAA